MDSEQNQSSAPVAEETKPKRRVTRKPKAEPEASAGVETPAANVEAEAAPATARKSRPRKTAAEADTSPAAENTSPSHAPVQAQEASPAPASNPEPATSVASEGSGATSEDLREPREFIQREHRHSRDNRHHNQRRQERFHAQASNPAGSNQGQTGHHQHHRHNNHPNRHQNNRQQFEKSRPLRIKYLDLLKEPEESIRNTAADLNIPNLASLTFSEVTFEVFSVMVQQEGQGLGVCKGILEILSDGYGFVRDQLGNIDQNDVYVSAPQIKKLGLRTGDYIVGQTRAPKDNESYHALLRMESINDCDPDEARKIVAFDSLVPLYPNQKFNLHTDAKDPSVRIVDLITPIGRGQRGLIVAPPKAGKTTLLKQIANALTSNHPDITLFVLLIDERPEEVTDMTRSVEGEVIASTFDQHLNNHIRVSEIVLERAKRLVEQGKDVVILLDSITRLARAYNIAIPSSGQTLSGGVNPLALYKPKKFFGSARNIEFGGSLTILATALVDTGSKMDDVIFEEFKGTGNMELHLDRALFNKRVFPAINLTKSSTRRDELLVSAESLKGLNILRRVFENLSAQEAIELLKKQVKTTRTNEDFLSNLQKQAGLSNT